MQQQVQELQRRLNTLEEKYEEQQELIDDLIATVDLLLRWNNSAGNE